MAAEIATPHRPTLSLDSRNIHVDTGVSQENLDPLQYESQDSSESNSPFTFTPRPYQPLAPASSNAQHLDARPNPQHRKGHSRSHSRQPTMALPSFSFNPGAATQSSSTTLSTPPATPTEEFPSSPSKSGRHRRSTSEYIGGSGATGPGGIRSASPSKRESSVSAPSTPIKPNAPSRGHRHRRSGAISSGDLSSLAKQGLHGGPQHSRGTSFGSLNNAVAKTNGLQTESSPNEASKEPMHAGSSPSRGRVGFSDTVEFIPRPLSTISSATESSLSTLRGHSKSGSASSVASFGPGSPPGKGFTFGLPITFEEDPLRPRPKSAGAELHHRRHPSFPCVEDGPHIQRRKSASSLVRSDSFEEPATAKNDTKSKKLGGWASSLLTRQPRPVIEAKQTSRSFHPSESSQPLELQPQPELLGSPELNEDFDNDPTSTIETHHPTYSFARPLSFTADLAKPSSSRQAIDDRASPLIDLDAAMSWGKPSTLQEFKGKGKSFSTARRSMHSSGVLSGFLGPGMHYHRRAESEPHLPFVEFNRSDVRYLHSSSAAYKGFEMENVFEEEQEDELSGSLTPDKVQHPARANDKDGLGVGIQVVELDDGEDSPIKNSFPRLRSSRHPGRRRIEPAQQDFSLLPSAGGVEIVGEDGGIDELGTRSSDSTLTSLDRPDDGQEEKRVDILPLALPQPPYMTPTASTESGYSTPYYGNSTFSTPRLDTSAGFLAEPRKYPSFAFSGEAGPEQRQSVDGVPSLISSRSTMTSAVNGQHMDSNSASVTDLSQAAPRSESMASLGSTTSRRRKRSSVASLSRIMGGSFGAKSNLSIEYNARCQTSHGAKEATEPKEKRTRRLSRMFRFFKSKENVADI